MVIVPSMIAAAPEYSGLGIAIWPLYSGFARSAHEAGRDFRPGVDRDARRDELGAEIGAVGVERPGGEPVDLRLRDRRQPSVFLQRLHRGGIGEQQHVRLGLAGGEFGGELAHHLGRSRAEDLDLDAGLRRA